MPLLVGINSYSTCSGRVFDMSLLHKTSFFKNTVTAFGHQNPWKMKVSCPQEKGVRSPKNKGRELPWWRWCLPPHLVETLVISESGHWNCPMKAHHNQQNPDLKKNECQMLLWNSCVVNTFAPEHIEIYLLEVVRLLGKHIHKTWRGLTSLANDGPMTPEGNTWGSSIKKQLPIWEKYYYPQLQHHLPPLHFNLLERLTSNVWGFPKITAWITWGCFPKVLSIFRTSFSWSCTAPLSPPKRLFPQVTTRPFQRTAAKAELVQ